MRFERLVIDSGVHTFTTEFHPDLTVIGGLAPPAREALAGELIDSLAGARPGVHLELKLADHSLTVFRPAAGKHRVVDTDSVSDVTGSHTGPDGSIDLFSSLGVDRALARRTMRLTRDDLTIHGTQDEVVTQLAAVDQIALWEAAARLHATDTALDRISEESGTSATDIALVDDVEKKHADLVAATETYERIRLISLTIADLGAIAGIALTVMEGAAGIPFLVLAAMGAALGYFYRQRVSDATEAEREVLTAVGVDDYATFHLERVNALLDGDQDRRRFMQAVSDHRCASDEWQALAGDIHVRVARKYQSEIEARAELRNDVDALHVLSDEIAATSVDATAELAEALLARIDGVRALTSGDDTLPLIIDDPFEEVDPAVKAVLLELLAATSGSPQLIVLTADEDVASWARLEQLAGRLKVVEPSVQKTSVPV